MRLEMERLMPPIEQGRTYTVDTFCEAERMARSQLYKLWRLGQGPRFYLNGTHRRITPQAREDWHRQMENLAQSFAV
jgi:hypothetical protein